MAGLQPLAELGCGMTRVTMPSRDSPGSVDPDDVEVAEVDTLFVSQGRAGAALGAAGCAGSGLLSSSVLPRAELCAQDGCGEREQVSGGAPRRPGARRTQGSTPAPAEPTGAEEACRLPSARNTDGKGSFIFCLFNMTSPLPRCLINLQRDYTSAGETTTCEGTYQPL